MIRGVVVVVFLSMIFMISACSHDKVVQNTIESKKEGNGTATFTVTELYCASCPFVIQSAMERVEGVKNVTIETKGSTGKVTVSYDDAKTDLTTIQKVVSDLGYGVK